MKREFRVGKFLLEDMGTFWTPRIDGSYRGPSEPENFFKWLGWDGPIYLLLVGRRKHGGVGPSSRMLNVSFVESVKKIPGYVARMLSTTYFDRDFEETIPNHMKSLYAFLPDDKRKVYSNIVKDIVARIQGEMMALARGKSSDHLPENILSVVFSNIARSSIKPGLIVDVDSKSRDIVGEVVGTLRKYGIDFRAMKTKNGIHILIPRREAEKVYKSDAYRKIQLMPLVEFIQDTRQTYFPGAVSGGEKVVEIEV